MTEGERKRGSRRTSEKTKELLHHIKHQAAHDEMILLLHFTHTHTGQNTRLHKQQLSHKTHTPGLQGFYRTTTLHVLILALMCQMSS